MRAKNKRTTISNDTLIALDDFIMLSSIFDCFNLFWGWMLSRLF